MATADRLDIDRVVQDPQCRIVVCCGSGGVGKTTTAAALALRAAEHGRQVVVLTIDPARRLAQSMGLTELDNVPRKVDGVDTTAGGRLDAMMLDMKRTFDEVVESHALPGKSAQILANPFYQALSSSFAGTQEYMAMEKLGQLRARADWDLIVADTPPSRSALDFLDAPERLGSFLDGRLIRVLMAPARAGGKAYLRSFSAAWRGDQHLRQDPRGRAAERHPDVRQCSGHHVRRLSRTRGPDLRTAQAAGDSFHHCGHARARCLAGGLVLRRTARGRRHAVGRAGAQPRPPRR